MKAIIQAYSPEEIERIARGEQTVKVCKTAPKETPFKVYMYKKPYVSRIKIVDEVLNDVYGGGKVVGEYVCDKVEECVPDYNPITQEFFYNEWEDCTASCMTSNEEVAYGKGKPLRGLHISAVKFYDKPKELSEFRTIKCTNKKGSCSDCDIKPNCIQHLTRPPQSWQYVENLCND